MLRECELDTALLSGLKINNIKTNIRARARIFAGYNFNWEGLYSLINVRLQSRMMCMMVELFAREYGRM